MALRRPAMWASFCAARYVPATEVHIDDTTVAWERRMPPAGRAAFLDPADAEARVARDVTCPSWECGPSP